MEIKAKEIVLFPRTKLSHYPKNVNRHSKEQIDRLVELIEHHGYRIPMIVDADLQPDGTHWVMAGNGRLEAAEREKWELLPVIFQTFKSEDEKYSFMVSDNAINATSWGGGLDFKQINLDLADLGPIDINHLGIKEFTVDPIEKIKEEKPVEIKFEYKLEVDCGDEEQQNYLNGELSDRGFKVRVLI